MKNGQSLRLKIAQQAKNLGNFLSNAENFRIFGGKFSLVGSWDSWSPLGPVLGTSGPLTPRDPLCGTNILLANIYKLRFFSGQVKDVAQRERRIGNTMQELSTYVCVFLIDEGIHCEALLSDDVWLMSNEFAGVPRLAVRCELYDIHPGG